jgi:hypothetical protein
MPSVPAGVPTIEGLAQRMASPLVRRAADRPSAPSARANASWASRRGPAAAFGESCCGSGHVLTARFDDP